MDVIRRRLLLSASALLLAPMAWAQSPGGKPAQGAPALGPQSTAEDAMRGLDLRGRTALVTGCTSGIGQEIMRVLALRGAHVLGTGRTLDKARAATDAVVGHATPLALELTDFDSIVAAAGEVERLGTPLDMLVCNAGIVLGALEQVRGLEKQFVVNHLGHHLLVRHLLPRVLAAPEGRVVVLGSGDHRRAPPGGIQFQRLSGEGWEGRGYAHSKLANGLFSLALARRLRDTRASSNCVSPGHVRSNILRNTGNRYGDNARSVAQGAATPCWLAAHPAMAGISGGFYRDFAPAEQSAHHTDAAMAARLWSVSDELVRDWLPRAG